MTPQHTGATVTDLSTWDSADFETQQNLAATGSADARPAEPQPTTPADTHYLAA